MNDEQKIEVCIFELGRLIKDREQIGNKEFRDYGTKLILAKVRELIQLDSPKKSEMPCNCQDKDSDRLAQAAKICEDFLLAMSTIR